MIKKNQSILNLLNGATDFIINVAALFLSYWLRFYVLDGSLTGQSLGRYAFLACANAGLCVLLYVLFRLYEPKRRTGFARDAWRIFQANGLSVLVLGLVLFVWRYVDFSRLLLLFHFIASTALIVAKHGAVRAMLNRMRTRGRNLKHILLVGNGRLSQRYLDALHKNPQFGYRVSGVVSNTDQSLTLPQDTSVLGTVEEIQTVLSQHFFDEVIVALDEEDVCHTQPVILACNIAGVRFSVIPYFTEYCFFATAPEVQNVGNVQVLDICASPLDSYLSRALKRSMDFLAALFIALLTSPVMATAALAVKLTSPGPVLFKQERVGRDKNNFYMYKFRSMQVNQEASTAWSQKGDARVTRWGKFMRKTSIDELPQLFNILKGDMSLVGPRPEIPYHVSHFREEIPYYMARHQIRPGLTGWAQVNGYRGDTSIEKRVQYDLFYIYNWSLVLDVRIILKTAFGGIISAAE